MRVSWASRCTVAWSNWGPPMLLFLRGSVGRIRNILRTSSMSAPRSMRAIIIDALPLLPAMMRSTWLSILSRRCGPCQLVTVLQDGTMMARRDLVVAQGEEGGLRVYEVLTMSWQLYSHLNTVGPWSCETMSTVQDGAVTVQPKGDVGRLQEVSKEGRGVGNIGSLRGEKKMQ